MDSLRANPTPLSFSPSFHAQGAGVSRPAEPVCRAPQSGQDSAFISSEAQEAMNEPASTASQQNASGGANDYRDSIKQMADGTGQAAGIARSLPGLARVAGPVGIGASMLSTGAEVHKAVTDPKLTSGQRSSAIGGALGAMTGGAAGGFAGGQAGAAVGMAIGTAIAPGLGTVVGGIAGSILGGGGGAYLGSKVGRSMGQEVGSHIGG